MQDLIVYFDGACEPRNPGGTMGCGAAIFKNKKAIWEYSESFPAKPTNTNNVAEYKALALAIDWLIANKYNSSAILVRGDSKLVIEQMFGNWRIKNGEYVPLAVNTKAKLMLFSDCKGQWIPREQNEYADNLSKAHLIARGIRITPR